MKIVSIKRLVLALILGLGSVMTLPAYAWPDTDEMNMCGAAVKKVRGYDGNHRGWAAHDNYVAHLGKGYYQRTNCPESKATKNYKGKYWTPKAKMAKKSMKKAKPVMMKKHKSKAPMKADACIVTDRLNSTGPAVYKKGQRPRHAHDDFFRQAQAVLNMGKTKKVSSITKKKGNDFCVVTNNLNTTGAAVRVVRKKQW